MVVGIESWKDLRTSLMKDVHGFAPHSLSTCRSQAAAAANGAPTIRRTNSLNSCQSLCSTNFSNDSMEKNEFPSSGFLDGIPLPPDEDEEEDWRMFGWLLDSAEANTSMDYYSYSSASEEENEIEDELNPKFRPYSPLPPLEIPSDESLPEAEDLLKVKRKPAQIRRFHSRPWWIPLKTGAHEKDEEEHDEDNRTVPQSRKRSISSVDDGDDEEVDGNEDEECESRPLTRSVAHYLELKRQRKIEGAPLPVAANSESKMEVEEAYASEAPTTVECKMESSACHVDSKPAKAEALPKIKKSASVISGRRCSKPRRRSTTHKRQPRNKNQKKSTLSVEKSEEELYCICKKPDDPTAEWIGCDGCEKWFHPECVGTTLSAVQQADEYFCPDCVFHHHTSK